jgi:hypothetical protein
MVDTEEFRNLFDVQNDMSYGQQANSYRKEAVAN